MSTGILLPRGFEPSLRSRYARNAAESANPGLWRGMKVALAPIFGSSGDMLVDAMGRNSGTAGLADANNKWDTNKHGMAIRHASNDNYTTTITSGDSVGYYGLHFSFLWLGQIDTYSINDRFWQSSHSEQVTSFRMGAEDAVVIVTTTNVSFSSLPKTVEDTKQWILVRGGGLGYDYWLYQDSLPAQHQSVSTTASGADSITLLGNPNLGNAANGSCNLFCFWDRALALGEVRQLVADPLAPFRLRPLVISVPAVEPPTTPATSVVVKRHAEPSLKSSYARNAAESANPGLWKGMVGAWVPELGDRTFSDVARCNSPAILDDIEWITGNPSARFNDASSNIYTPLRDNIVDNGSVICSFSASDDTSEYLFCHRRATSDTRIYLSVNSGVLQGAYGSGGSTGTRSVTVGQRHCGALTWHDRANALVYLDDNPGESVAGTHTGNRNPFVVVGAYSSSTSYPLSTSNHFGGDVFSVLVFNRVLTPNEIRHLSSDPLAPFRLRPLVISVPAVEETPGTNVPAVVKRHAEPSLKSGYARNAAESANPGLWRGMQSAYCPAFGPTGLTLHDVSGNQRHGTLTNMDPGTDWQMSEMGWVLNYPDGTDKVVLPVSVLPDAGSAFSVSFWAWKDSYDTQNDGAFGYDGGSQPYFVIYPYDTFGGNGIRVYWNGATIINETAATETDWNLFTFVSRSNDDHEMYRNGTSIQTSSSSQYLHSSPTAATIGNSGSLGQVLDGKVGTFLTYNRALTPTEIRHLSRDPLAPFRLRPLVISVPAVEPPATTATSVVVKRHAEPSIKSGYARNAAESANPGLWRGMVLAVCPALGGGFARDEITKTSGTVGASAQWNDVISPIGRASTGDGTASSEILTNVTGPSASHARSVFQFLKYNTAATDYCFGWGGVSSYTAWRCRLDTTDRQQRIESVTSYMEGTTDIFGRWVAIGHSYPGGQFSNITMYADGKVDPKSLSGGGSVTPNTTATDVYILSNNSGSGGIIGSVAVTYIWDRAIAANEHALLYRDPLAPFRLRPLVISAPAAEAPVVPTLLPAQKIMMVM